MSGSTKFKGDKEKRDGGQFVIVPVSVLNSAAYLQCSPHARMLLFDLYAQYRGDNNGDLCAPWKVMKKRGWRSEETLNKAKRQLIDAGLIQETRKGARPNQCSLYAVTWRSLDYCGGKLDITEKGFNRSAYKLHDLMPPIRPRKAIPDPPSMRTPG